MTMRKLLLTGGSGDLGSRLVTLAAAPWEVTATYFAHPGSQPDIAWRYLDVRDAIATTALVAAVRPDVIIHAAAVNPAPNVSFEAVNSEGTRAIALAAARYGARLIHISTDVVFDGTQAPYTEAASPTPITDYGRSKAQAEAAVSAANGTAVIVRTSLIYGWQPRVARQVQWIIDGLRAGTLLRLFTDEIRCPVWIDTLAAALLELATLPYTGILNVAGAQALSRYALGVRFARAHGYDPDVIVPASSRADNLLRPLDCTLDCTRARALLRTPLPGVDEVLATLQREKREPFRKAIYENL